MLAIPPEQQQPPERAFPLSLLLCQEIDWWGCPEPGGAAWSRCQMRRVRWRLRQRIASLVLCLRRVCGRCSPGSRGGARQPRVHVRRRCPNTGPNTAVHLPTTEAVAVPLEGRRTCDAAPHHPPGVEASCLRSEPNVQTKITREVLLPGLLVHNKGLEADQVGLRRHHDDEGQPRPHDQLLVQQPPRSGDVHQPAKRQGMRALDALVTSRGT